MQYYLDACSLIYLVKTGLASKFWTLAGENVAIDTSVYQEVVEEGKKLQYPDSIDAENFIKNQSLPIIPIDVSNEIANFRDPGETSCFILSQQGGICVTSDIKAIKRMRNFNALTITLDAFFYKHWLDQTLTREEFTEIIIDLEQVNAITPERRIFYENQINSEEPLQ